MIVGKIQTGKKGPVNDNFTEKTNYSKKLAINGVQLLNCPNRPKTKKNKNNFALNFKFIVL